MISPSLRTRILSVRAVIFDMDGILIDSEHQHFAAHKQAIEEAGGSLTKDFYIRHGVSRDDKLFYADVFPDRAKDREFLNTIDLRKQEVYRQKVEKEGIVPIRPAIELAAKLHAKRMPIGIATGIQRSAADHALEKLGIRNLFSAVVTATDPGMQPKPNPDVYQEAARRLGFAPTFCLVIEDSKNGVQAALSAGCTCVVVPGEFTKNHDFTGATVTNFVGIQELFS